MGGLWGARRATISALIAALIVATMIFGVGSPAVAQGGNSPLVVNSTGDQADANGADGVCRTGAGTCTLRAAIAQANYNRGADVIRFNISGSGVRRIVLGSALPTLNDPSGGVFIDGYTQPGSVVNNSRWTSNAALRIEVQGPTNANAFTIESAENTIRGLAIFGARINIELRNEDADGNTIIGNFIGTDAGGTFERSGGSGIMMNLGPDQNVIGTSARPDRNVISGNGAQGIRINHGGTSRNVIQNNIVGLNPTGTRELRQGLGIDIQWWSWGNLVGGDGPDDGNLLGGATQGGMDLSHSATGNVVIGNRIGTTPDGRSATDETANRWGVILKDDPVDNYIGNNVISGNREHGIWHKQNYTGRNTFVGNKIGVGADGSAVGNGFSGVYLTGHDDIYYGNIVANNGRDGFEIHNGSIRTAANFPDELTERNRVRTGTFYRNDGPLITIAGPAHPNADQPTITGAGPGQLYGNGTCSGCVIDVYVSGTINGNGSVTPGPSGISGVQLEAEHSGLCIEVAGASTADSANAQQGTCNNGANQRFEMVPAGAGFLLRATHANKCLDVTGASQANGANVIQFRCHGGDNQILRWSGNSLVFAHSNKCLDITGGLGTNGANLQQFPCTGGENQRFKAADATAFVWVGSTTAAGNGTFSMGSNALQAGVVATAVATTPNGETSTFSGHVLITIPGFGLGSNPSPAQGAPAAPARPPLPEPYQPTVFECSHSGGTLTWTNVGANEYYVFATTAGQERYLGGHNTTTLNVSAADSYRVEHWTTGTVTNAVCNGPGGGGNFTCSAANGVLTWTNVGANEYYVFATTAGQERYLGGHNTTTLNVGGAETYRVEHWITGQVANAVCNG